jgi:hypothetical protein
MPDSCGHLRTRQKSKERPHPRSPAAVFLFSDTPKLMIRFHPSPAIFPQSKSRNGLKEIKLKMLEVFFFIFSS